MKITAVSLIIAIVLLQSSMKAVIVAAYQINKKYITEKFCENKSRPSLRCNGKCFLGKKIEAQKKQEDKKSGTFSLQEETNLYYVFSTFSLPLRYFSTIDKSDFCYVSRFYPTTIKDIFQPPC